MRGKFRIKKRYIVFGSIVVALFLLLFFLSSIVRWYIVKNSVDLIGRKVDLQELHINYFKCSVKAEGFTMYEKNLKDKFVSFQELYVNFDLWNLLHHELAFSEIRLDKPWVSVVYNDSIFNFNDLISSSDTAKADTTVKEKSDTLKFLVKNLNINGGYIRYEDKNSGSNTELKDLGIKVPEISWNSKQSEMGIKFVLGKGGEVAVDGMINQVAGKYFVSLKTKNIDITPFAGYARGVMNADITSGKFYSNLKVAGDMSKPANIKVYGEAGLKDVVVNEAGNRPFCTFKNIYVRIDSLDIGNSNFCIGKVLLEEPQIIAVLERGTTNIQGILAPVLNDTSEVADTAADSTIMHYSIDSLTIKGGTINFSDLTLNRPFRYDIKNLDIKMNSFSDAATYIPVSFSMNLNGSGTFTGKTTLDMVNTSNIIFDGAIANLDMVSFSPYSEYYLARPIVKGILNYKCKLKMTPANLDNMNNLKMAHVEFGKKTKDTTSYKVPVCLALYIIKDREGMIRIDLPVTGKPSDPSFKLRKIIWKTLEEFLLKAVTAPFNAIGNMFGADPESIRQIPLEYLQDSLTDGQRSKLEKICEIITKKPELSFTFIQTTDPEKEKNMIALQEAKFLFVSQSMQAGTDPTEIKKNAVKVTDFDPAFVTFLGIESAGDHGDLMNRCMQLIGAPNVEEKFSLLLQKRETIIKAYFAEKSFPQGAVTF